MAPVDGRDPDPLPSVSLPGGDDVVAELLLNRRAADRAAETASQSGGATASPGGSPDSAVGSAAGHASGTAREPVAAGTETTATPSLRSEEEREASERWRVQLAARAHAARIVRDDITRLSGRVTARTATPIEFDAYWFVRTELEKLVKAGLDWSQARQDSDLLDRLPRVRAQMPQAPLVLQELGAALATFRRAVLEAGYVLPFRQLRPDLEDEDQAAQGDTWLRVPCLLPDHDATRAWGHVPAWLQQDQPALDVRWADGGPASRHVELDADLALLVRRQQHDLPEDSLRGLIEELRLRLASAEAAGLWTVPDRWCRWHQWAAGAPEPRGYFSEVLASPLHTMDFINAHRPLLVNLAQMEADALLDAVQAPTRRMLQHWQAVVDDQHCLQAWLEAETASPPLHRFNGRLRHHDAFATITRLDQEVDEAAAWLRTFGEAAADAVQSMPSALTAGIERAQGAQRASFLRGFRSALFVRPGRWSPAQRGEGGVLERQTVNRISRVAHGFPQLPAVPDPVWEGRIWGVIGAVPIGVVAWIGSGLLVVGVLAGAAAGALARFWARGAADARVAAIKVPGDAVDIALRWARLGGDRTK